MIPDPKRPFVAVIGSRSWTDEQRVFNVLDKMKTKLLGMVVISGACPQGPDYLAEVWARKNGVVMMLFPADWSQGKEAGFTRNQFIIDASEIVLAFWDGKSRGTLDSIQKAFKAEKPVYLSTVQNPRMSQVKTIEEVKQYGLEKT
jgi:hypothetical protein